MTKSLVDTSWVADHLDDPNVRLIEIKRANGNADSMGHVPGAVGWHWKSMLWDPFERQFPSSKDFADRLGAIGVTNDTTIVLYGVPVQYGTYAWWVLKYMGHKDVRLLDGGSTLWKKEGRALSSATPKFAPVTYRSNPRNERMRAGRDDVLVAVESSDTCVLDHRSREEYAGARVSPLGMDDYGAERYGHIPGALHLPYDALLTPDDTFKPKDSLLKLVEPLLKALDTPIIGYCRLSHRSTLAYFALTEILDYQDVRVYDGSWTEWGSMVGMPIER